MSEATPEEASAGTAMRCPKCGAEMRTHQRNGVNIEQCRKCHGIFLDRGEFEQLLARESSYLGNGDDLPAGNPAGRALRWRRWRR